MFSLARWSCRNFLSLDASTSLLVFSKAKHCAGAEKEKMLLSGQFCQLRPTCWPPWKSAKKTWWSNTHKKQTHRVYTYTISRRQVLVTRCECSRAEIYNMDSAKPNHILFLQLKRPKHTSKVQMRRRSFGIRQNFRLSLKPKSLEFSFWFVWSEFRDWLSWTTNRSVVHACLHVKTASWGPDHLRKENRREPVVLCGERTLAWKSVLCSGQKWSWMKWKAFFLNANVLAWPFWNECGKSYPAHVKTERAQPLGPTTRAKQRRRWKYRRWVMLCLAELTLLKREIIINYFEDEMTLCPCGIDDQF